GFHSYNSSAPVNRYLKSRESHNVASIMSFKHNDDAPVELVAHEINAQYHDFTLIDRGYEDIDLTRRVLYLIDPDCWIVSDQAVTDARVQLSQSWTVEPGVIPRVRDNGF